MKTPALIAVVTALHLVAVGSFFFIQGCGTQHPSVEPPPAPVMPPTDAPVSRPLSLPPPVFQPPVAVEKAPPVAVLGEDATYTIQKGDSLSKIASRFGVKTRDLAELNGISNLNKIRIGQKLLLPAYAKQGVAGTAPVVRHAPKAPSVVAGPGSVYVVQRGDNLTKIAKKHGITLKNLRAANSFKSDKILVGQKINIPGQTSAPAIISAPVVKPVSVPPPMNKPRSKPVVKAPAAPVVVPAPTAVPSSVSSDQDFPYIVSEGDTLDSIARDFVVLKEDLLRANGLSETATVTSGQKLVIPMVSPSDY